MADEAAEALGYLDQILAQRPKPDHQLFSRCTEKLATLRDCMIGAGPRGTRLEHVNAIISVVLAGHFPLGPVPWDELRLARAWLADVAAADTQPG